MTGPSTLLSYADRLRKWDHIPVCEHVFPLEDADDGQSGDRGRDMVHHRRAHHVLDVLDLPDPRDEATAEHKVQNWRREFTGSNQMFAQASLLSSINL